MDVFFSVAINGLSFNQQISPAGKARMLFYEPLFLVIFPVIYALYLLQGGPGGRKWILLAASALFYAWGEPAFVVILLLSTAIDYALSFYLGEANPKRTRSLAITAGVAQNLGILAVYKYCDFAIQSLNAVLAPFNGTPVPLLKLALPIGVSFVVFEKITYLVDTYRGISKPAPRFSDYCLFVLFFPKLLAGPILKYHEMKDQIEQPAGASVDGFLHGFQRFVRGLIRKLLIADTLGAFANQVFAADPGNLAAASAWLGLAAFTIQIYFDFAGYSDMAIGLARMMGFKLNENFNSPYASRSITEFWRRWHISLTTWIRDYLYVPLGGNRGRVARTYVNLWVCFLLSGLWHGAGWNFILWGAYNGLFLVLDRLFLLRWLERCGPVVATAATLFIVMIGWAIFRSESLGHLGPFLAALFGTAGNRVHIAVSHEVAFTLAAGVLISLIPATPLLGYAKAFHERHNSMLAFGMSGALIFYIIAAARAISSPFQPFIYFRF